MKRYVIEYANDRIKRLEEWRDKAIQINPKRTDAINEDINKDIEVITKTVFNCEYGFMDIDKAMLIISEPSRHYNEVIKK